MNEAKFQQIIKYEFRQVELLCNALTHSSFSNEGKAEKGYDNERLEFLGDAIFDAIISEHLYNRLSKVEEGRLTKIRATIVCESALAQCGRQLSLGSFLNLGRGEENSGGRRRNSILADAMEAIIAAIYLDGGWEKAREFVLYNFAQIIDEALSGKRYTDYKTDIQERLQAHGDAEITYVTDRAEGPDHDKTFYVNLVFNGKVIGRGHGRSKKEAEQKAAKQALEKGDHVVF